MKKLSTGLVQALVMAAGVFAGWSLAEQVLAQEAEPRQPAALEAYAAYPDFVQVRLSPDGRYLSALTPIKGKRNLVVLDLKTMKPRAITAITRFDVVEYTWVGSEFLTYSVGLLDTPTGPESGMGGGLFSVRVDGTGYRKLSPTLEEQRDSGGVTAQRMKQLSAVPGSGREILVSANLRTQRDDIYRVDLDSGKRTLLSFDKPGLVDSWLVDSRGVPRVALVEDKENVPESELTRTIMYRDSLESPWRELARFPPNAKGRWWPQAFAPDDRNLIVASNPQRDTMAWYLYDVDKKALGEVLVSHPRFDATEARLVRDAEGRRPVGLVLRADRPEVAWFDEELSRLQAGMEAQFPGLQVDLQRSAGDLTLVTAYSDRRPHEYYLFDAKARSLKQVLRSRSDLGEKDLVAMRPFLLKARDGLEIPSYYFLPASYRAGQKLPTVVHIHGGPHVRADFWGQPESSGVREAQLLASRGYAVVLPNFRVTPGLGAKVYWGGMGQVGRKMSDDHEDAARWAVAQGFADPGRICISGGSYGGYAALWATIRSADTFKCAVAGHVVSNLELQLTSPRTDFHQNKYGIDEWRRMIGQSEPGWAQAREVSPALHAERSTVPLFIYAGQDDRRTPMEQTDAMVSALTKAGRPPEVVMVKLEEGHGYGKLENRVDLYRAMLQFLDKHIGSGPTP